MNGSTIVTGREDPIARGWTASSRADFDRTFRSARRHSRGVRILRIAIPAGIVSAVVVLSLAVWLNPLRGLPLPPGTKLRISGTKVMMEIPRIVGYTNDKRPYEFTAGTAAQDLTRRDVVELTDIRAKIESPDKSLIEMTAANGIYNTKAEQLVLGERIVLVSPNYEALLSEAVIDMRRGHVVSDKPVEVRLTDGVLNANRLEITGSGEVLRFDGGVSMTLKLNNADRRGTTSP